MSQLVDVSCSGQRWSCSAPSTTFHHPVLNAESSPYLLTGTAFHLLMGVQKQPMVWDLHHGSSITVPTRGKRAPATAKKRKRRTSQRQISPIGRKSRPHSREKSASHNQKRKRRTSQRQISTRKKRPSPRGGKERQLSHEEAAPAISAANLPSEEKPAPRGGKERRPSQRGSTGHLSSKSLPAEEKAVPTRGKRAPATAKTKCRTYYLFKKR